MRTTLKRAVGRVVAAPTDVLALDPLAVVAPVAFYRAAPRSGRTRVRRFTIALIGTALVLSALLVGAAGGAFLWFDRSVTAVQTLTPALSRAEKELSIPLPGKPAVALLLGIDTRDGSQGGSDNTDAMMLVRADPSQHTISLLSFPRDLNVPIYCSGHVIANDRINDALALCGPKGVLETMEHLTGVSINYIISVDFHGFKKIVNEIGGIWIDVDRSYYNKNVGTAATDYSNIDLQPGYQLLTGGQALEFVRFRHTDSDLYRLAREQEFVRAVKEQISQHFDPLRLPGIVSAITGNVQLASKSRVSDETVLQYALFAATLPPGHVYQATLSSNSLLPLEVGGASELSATPATIQQAVSQFEHPRIVGARASKPAAVHRPAKPALPAPPRSQTTLTVLNGNGVAGAAAAASGLLGAKGYRVLPPPGGLPANAPTMDYPETQIYFDPSRPKATAAASSLAALIRPATVRALPSDPRLRALDPSSMLVVVLGRSFTGELTPPSVPLRQETAASDPPAVSALVQTDPAVGRTLLDPLAHRVSFPLEDPTVLEGTSQPDDLGGDQPVRLYQITKGVDAVRLVFVTGGSQYWGIEETSWSGAPVLGDDNLQRTIKGRSFDLYYANGHLHMVVLRANGATYWVVNSLLNSLSNPTMIAIAEGLHPLGAGRST